MKQLLLVFIGGGFGSMTRYILAKYLNDTAADFPYGTFLANVIGSLLIGVILGLAVKSDTLSENQILLLATGFCGGFTTFSTFAYENHHLLKSGNLFELFIYTMATFTLALGAVFLGIYLTKFA